MIHKMTPNFQPKDIVKTIQKLTEKGLEVASRASQGMDWQSVVGRLDKVEFELGQHTSVHAHLNAVMFTEDFNIE